MTDSLVLGINAAINIAYFALLTYYLSIEKDVRWKAVIWCGIVSSAFGFAGSVLGLLS